MHNGGNVWKGTMSRAMPIMLTVVVQFVLTTTPTISEARRVMDLNYDDTRFHLQEEYRHVDPHEAQVRLSMFVTKQLQEGSSRKETVRRVLHHALQEHRRRLPGVRRQVTAGGTLNATLLRQWFSTCVHRQAANSFFHALPLVDNQKAEFLAKFLNSTPRRRPLDRVKVGLPAAEILTEGGFSRPRENHKRVRRDGPAVMYLPVGAGGSSSDCPDSVDAAAVSISQLVFLSLSLGVFTAVANIANNINNNNNNNNNNNDNNINSNNLNFAANANSGNQITVQLPPPTGRGRRDLHELWQAHLAALRHRRGERLVQSTIKRTQRKRREVDVTSGSFAEVPDRQTPSRGADGNADTAATNQPRMDLNYDINYDIRDMSYDTRDVNYNTGDLNIIERESINIPLGLSHFTEARDVMSLNEEQTETTSVVKEFRHTTKETSTRQDDLGSPLTDPVLEEHYQGILQIANRHGYFLPPQEVPRLLRRLHPEHNPTETSAALSLSDDNELTTGPTVARPTRTSSAAAPSGDSSRGILGNSTVQSSGRYSTESETSKDSASADSPIVASANTGENERAFHTITLLEPVESLMELHNVSQVPLASLSRQPLPPLLHLSSLQSLESHSTPLSQSPRPSPSPSTKGVPKSPPSAVDARSSSRSSASSTDVPPSSVSMEGVAATWALKAAMTWSVWASLSSPPCLGQYLCQLLQMAPKGSTWSHALAGYYLQTSLTSYLTYTFTDYLREARLGRCRHLFPDCQDPPSVPTS